jgi:hypothetical protein
MPSLATNDKMLAMEGNLLPGAALPAMLLKPLALIRGHAYAVRQRASTLILE